jgi:hypothetical protein
MQWQVNLGELTGKSGFSVEWLQTIHISCPSRSLWSGTWRMCDQKRESLCDAGQMRLCTCRKTSVSSAIFSITVICSTVAATHKRRGPVILYCYGSTPLAEAVTAVYLIKYQWQKIKWYKILWRTYNGYSPSNEFKIFIQRIWLIGIPKRNS